ncbi:DNA (cytosine-5-)-methyltransferase [Spiroplasma endosymbiont of Diplazon laetatorius]|uniref:DNA cytosine methyltransferase n=1 Tax=Spiroplasma endosymbiont of Diplazon laetatorius TaxID=3066322 RepID=UPI0030D1AA41
MKEVKFIDLFAGIGGFHYALKAALKEIDKKNNPKCVFVSEIDDYAKKVYSINFNYNIDEIINIRDVKKSDIEDHDFLFAGFPCQTFSNAGKKMGFLDQIRGTLFFEIAEILSIKKPKYFILENVKHLVKHNNGETFNTIINTINDLGYLTTEKPVVISATQIGVPQKRERVYILGVRKDLVENKEFIDSPKPYSEIKYFSNEIVEKNVDEFYYGLVEEKVKIAIEAWGEFLKNVKPPKGRTMPVIWFDYLFTNIVERKKILNNSTISEWRKKYFRDMWEVYDDNSTYINKWRKKYNVDEWQAREKKFEWQAGIGNFDIKNSFIQLRQSGIRCRRKEDFPTLVAMVQTPLIFDDNRKKWRYLTPNETGKLQNFYKIRDEDIDLGFKSYSELFGRSQRHDFITQKQFGNSININVVKQLIIYILNNFWS